MREIEWYENYELGFPAIDNDHRRLFDAANRIIRALGDGKFAECKRLAGEFVDTLKQHFPREEGFLREIGYPGLETHAGYHRQLLERAEKFTELCNEATDWASIKEPLAELISVLVADLRGGDLNFRTFLVEKGLDKALIEERLGANWL